MKYITTNYVNALNTLQQSLNEYEENIKSFTKLQASSPYHKQANEKALFQLDMVHAILEAKFTLCKADYTPKKVSFSNNRLQKNYRRWESNGLNMKCVYNQYPLKWCEPPKPWFPYSVKYMKNSL